VIEGRTKCIDRFTKSHVYACIDINVYVIIYRVRVDGIKASQQPPAYVPKGIAERSSKKARKTCPQGSDLALGTGRRSDDTSADRSEQEK
jgi:hypothetical protein